MTNVNFDPEALADLIRTVAEKTQSYKQSINVEIADPASAFIPAGDIDGLIKQGEACGHLGIRHEDSDINSLIQILLYGVRGTATYTHHAAVLGKEDHNVYAFIHQALASLTDTALNLNDWLNLALKYGEINLRAMELLDEANTGTFGHPEPTEVALGHKAGKCILVSGHDLKDLKMLLEQTDGKDINIYTHGEMLPAHACKHIHYRTGWLARSSPP